MGEFEVEDGGGQETRIHSAARWAVRISIGSFLLLIAVALVDLVTLALGQQCSVHVACTGSRGLVDALTRYAAIIGLIVFVISIVAAPVLSFMARAETP